jgi:hypothetical protein
MRAHVYPPFSHPHLHLHMCVRVCSGGWFSIHQSLQSMVIAYSSLTDYVALMHVSHSFYTVCRLPSSSPASLILYDVSAAFRRGLPSSFVHLRPVTLEFRVCYDTCVSTDCRGLHYPQCLELTSVAEMTRCVRKLVVFYCADNGGSDVARDWIAKFSELTSLETYKIKAWSPTDWNLLMRLPLQSLHLAGSHVPADAFALMSRHLTSLSYLDIGSTTASSSSMQAGAFPALHQFVMRTLRCEPHVPLLLESLSSVSALRLLDLDYSDVFCEATAEFKARAWRALGLLTQLDRLYVECIQLDAGMREAIENSPPVAGITRITAVAVRRRTRPADFSCLSRMTNLVHLWLVVRTNDVEDDDNDDEAVVTIDTVSILPRLPSLLTFGFNLSGMGASKFNQDVLRTCATVADRFPCLTRYVFPPLFGMNQLAALRRLPLQSLDLRACRRFAADLSDRERLLQFVDTFPLLAELHCTSRHTFTPEALDLLATSNVTVRFDSDCDDEEEKGGDNNEEANETEEANPDDGTDVLHYKN